MLKQIFTNPFVWVPVLVFVVYALFFHEFEGDPVITERVYVENKVRTVEVPRLKESVEKTGDAIEGKLGSIKESITESTIGKAIKEKILAPALKKKFGTSNTQIIASTLQGLSRREVVKQGSGAVIKCGDEVAVDLSGQYQSIRQGTKDLPAKYVGKKSITIGAREVVPGLERQLVGVRPGAELVVTVPHTEGYGLQAFKDKDIPEKSAVRYKVSVLDVKPRTFKLRRPAVYTDQKEGRGQPVACGDKVKIKYVLFAVGPKEKKIISEAGKNEKEFTIGLGHVPVGVETGMENMRLGGVRNIIVPADQLYTTSKKNLMPEVKSLKKGQGVIAIVILKEVNDQQAQSPEPRKE